MVVFQVEAEEDNIYRCLSDFVAPASSGVKDYVGMFAVTTGHGCQLLVDKCVLYINQARSFVYCCIGQ